MEAALMGLPCVVLYRFAPLNYMIGKALVHIENFSLPNILLGEQFETELLQDAVTPEAITRELLPLYRGEEHRAWVSRKLDEACKRLGPPGASGRVAEKILAAARRHSSSNGDET
jgi:lipid-A-disaccharide synthase